MYNYASFDSNGITLFKITLKADWPTSLVGAGTETKGKIKINRCTSIENAIGINPNFAVKMWNRQSGRNSIAFQYIENTY